tara:strand:- start:172 stop:351 length:180 start_codon:yes stop_codon:yes gene_type:complete
LLAKSYDDEAAAGQFFRRAPAALDSSGSDPLKISLLLISSTNLVFKGSDSFSNLFTANF